jgi:predicted component of type VI protein secretion system
MQASGSFRLTMRQGPVPGKVFELAKDVMTIGRDVSNDIVINDAEVSRNHARLTAQSGGYLLEDLASTNGTFVNGQRLIGPKLISAGDVVGLGETVVLDYGQAADAGATVIASGRMLDDIRSATPPPPPAEPVYTPPPPVAEPMPPPTMAEPIYTPPPVSEPAYTPPPPVAEPVYTPPPSAPPPPAAKKDNRNLYIGLGCGCLTLCGCGALAALAWQYGDMLMAMLGM